MTRPRQEGRPVATSAHLDVIHQQGTWTPAPLVEVKRLATLPLLKIEIQALAVAPPR